MKFLRSARALRAASPRPGLACEITPAGVAAGRVDRGDGSLTAAFAAFPAGTLAPGLKGQNFRLPKPAATALRQALQEVAPREEVLTLVIPDAAVRVLLLDFDTLPAKVSEALPIVRFRLRKLVPFDVEDAAVSYQIVPAAGDAPGGSGGVRLVAAAIPSAILAEYESAVREAGHEPGAVLSSTLAALAAVEGDRPALVVNHGLSFVTTAITRGNELLLHRMLEFDGGAAPEPVRQPSPEDLLPAGLLAGTPVSIREAALLSSEPQAVTPAATALADHPGTDPLTSGPLSQGQDAVEELRRAVSVAIAYFEDTLGAPPQEILGMGAGGAAELRRLLGDPSVPIRDLFLPETGAINSIPPGVLAGIRGALAG